MSIEAQIFTHRRLRNPCAKRESHYGIRGEHHIALGRDEEVGPGHPLRRVTDTPCPQRPYAPSLWLALTQWDPEILSAKISSFKPPAIKHLLGDPNLTIGQLRQSSCTLALDTNCVGSYVDALDSPSQAYAGFGTASPEKSSLGARGMTYHRSYHVRSSLNSTASSCSHEAQVSSGRKPHLLASTLVPRKEYASKQISLFAELLDTMMMYTLPERASGRQFDSTAGRLLWDNIRSAAEARANDRFPRLAGLNFANQMIQGHFAVHPDLFPTECACGAKMGIQGGRACLSIVPGDPSHGHECSPCHSRRIWRQEMPPFVLEGFDTPFNYVYAYRAHIKDQARWVLIDGQPDACVDCGRPRTSVVKFYSSGPDGRYDRCFITELHEYEGLQYNRFCGLENAKLQWQWAQ